MGSISTPNKSRIYVRLNCSDRTRFNSIRSSPGDRDFQKLYPIIKKRKRASSQNFEDVQSIPNDASRNLRVRRVFSPSSSIDENEEHLVPEDLKQGLENGESVLGAENCGFDIKSVADEELNNVATLDHGSRVNTRESVQHPANLIRPNESISINKQVVKPSLLSKVVKTSSSFSYRRLLPFLMGLNDESCTSEIKIDDKVPLQSGEIEKNNFYAPETEPYSKPLQSGERDNLVIKSPCKQLEQNCDKDQCWII